MKLLDRIRYCSEQYARDANPAEPHAAKMAALLHQTVEWIEQNHEDFVAWQDLAKELYLECMGHRIEGDWEELMIRAKKMLSEARLLGED